MVHTVQPSGSHICVSVGSLPTIIIRATSELGQNTRPRSPLIHFNLANFWPPLAGNSIMPARGTKERTARRRIRRRNSGRGRRWNCGRDYPVRSIKVRSLIAFCRFECAAALLEIRLNRSLNCPATYRPLPTSRFQRSPDFRCLRCNYRFERLTRRAYKGFFSDGPL